MTTTIAPTTDRNFFVLVAVLSAGALGFLAWLLMLRGGSAGTSSELSFLPAVNASFNATSAVLLTAGYAAIKSKRPVLHRTFMVLALTTTVMFFVSYVIYHYAHGDTKYLGTGPMRTVYFVVLASHVLLSIPLVPLVLVVVWFAATRRFERHKRFTRITLPIWLYVSVTGVAIFFLLRAGNSPG